MQRSSCAWKGVGLSRWSGLTDVMDISRIPRRLPFSRSPEQRTRLSSSPGIFYLATTVAIVAVIAERLTCIGGDLGRVCWFTRLNCRHFHRTRMPAQELPSGSAVFCRVSGGAWGRAESAWLVPAPPGDQTAPGTRTGGILGVHE